MSTGIWKLSLFLVATGLIMIAAGLIWRSYVRNREILKGHTTATVVRLLTREDPAAGDSQFHMKYYPVFEYYADSKRCSEVYPFGSYPSRYKVGEKMQIDYDIGNPKDYEIHRYTYHDFMPSFLYMTGVGLLSVGAVLFIIFAARSQNAS